MGRSSAPAPHRTTGCRRRQTASARASLPLFAAPEPQRWAPRAREAKPRGNSPGSEALPHLRGRLFTRGSITRRGTALLARVQAPRRTVGIPPRHGQAQSGVCNAARPAGPLGRPTVAPGRGGPVPQGAETLRPDGVPRGPGRHQRLGLGMGVAAQALTARATVWGAVAQGGGSGWHAEGGGRREGGGRPRSPRRCPAPPDTGARRAWSARRWAPEA